MARKTKSPKLSSGSAKKQVSDDVRLMHEALVEALCVRFNAHLLTRSPLTLSCNDGSVVSPSTLSPVAMRNECQSREVSMDTVLLHPAAWKLLYPDGA
jgi:hypothetical protein